MRISDMRRLHPLLLLLLLPAAASAGPDSGTLVVLNKGEATASLIDLATGKVVETLAVGDGPHEAAASPDGRIVAAGNYGRREPGNSITLIDVADGRRTKTIDLGEYRRPHGIRWLDDRRMAVTCEANRAVIVVDAETGKIERAIPTEQNVSHMIAVTPDGARAFVANIGSGSVTVLDLAEGKRLRSVPTGKGAEGVDVTPDGREVWVTNRAADAISVIDAETLTVVAEVPCASFPIRIAILPDGGKALVTNARSGDVAVIDVKARKEVARVKMEIDPKAPEDRLFGGTFGKSPVPIGVLVAPEGKHAFVANANADLIAVVDLTTNTVTGTLKAGREPDGMAWSPLKVSDFAPLYHMGAGSKDVIDDLVKRYAAEGVTVKLLDVSKMTEAERPDWLGDSKGGWIVTVRRDQREREKAVRDAYWKEMRERLKKTDPPPLKLGEWKELPEETVAAIGAELAKRVAVDQAVRKDPSRHGEMGKVDADNTAWLRKTVTVHGWIDAGRFGRKAANAAFLLVQHSGDLALMKAALPLIEMDVRAGSLDGQSYALLYDRLQLMQGGKQRYGTQIVKDEEKGGWVVLRLEDPDRVDERRKSIGLGPLKDYLKLFGDDVRIDR
jgi:YVTN family beta-propeller protein